jgi:hypothetical protein
MREDLEKEEFQERLNKRLMLGWRNITNIRYMIDEKFQSYSEKASR